MGRHRLVKEKAMDDRPRGTFTGFSPQTVTFLSSLAGNNTKAWFETHRGDYEERLLEPMKALVAELSDFMLSIDQDFVTVPGRAISRIHRDTRFSRDKSPYKTTLWITFKRQITEWRDAPCYFFELTACSYRFGMGFYSASKGTMDRLRETIERKPAQFRETVAFLGGQKRFVLEGEVYRRPLRHDLPEDLQEWHRRKNLYLVCNRQPDNALFSRKLVDDLRTGFGMLAPFYDYLLKARV
ncbi:protein of unknown function DUF2461 [Geobacter metallireducens GS-15]|uniref:TIGR02453 family protein n=2 Tax=Geobacter metallireducens TaxID=28232 RepID=Q39RF6_GEOMG|nr:protein of unknown function DUF2461 [Geobacter metallireducens GS-15]